MRKAALIMLMLIMAGMFFYTASSLPKVGDPQSPASSHVSPRYIEKSYQETGSPNFVAAVLADYRSIDTLGETTVIFVAGVATVMILVVGSRKPRNLRGGEEE